MSLPNPTPTSPLDSTPDSLPAPHQSSQAVELGLAAFAALGYAVSARLLVFLALVGAFVLAVMSMSSQTIMSATILALYAVLIVIPLVALEARKHLKDH